LMALIREIRAVRSQYDVKAGHRIAATIAGGPLLPMLQTNVDILNFLARLDPEKVQLVEYTNPLQGAAAVVVGDVVAYLPLAGMVDLEAERARLHKELAALERRIKASEARLAGPFAERAPSDVVARERERLADMKTEAQRIREEIDRLAKA
ncbi:MAG TPA: valine--tRNA ligase, partial [Chloroflexi bacterium]|nr:valine--tRNA ligase [Chloroflexota bacterium]